MQNRMNDEKNIEPPNQTFVDIVGTVKVEKQQGEQRYVHGCKNQVAPSFRQPKRKGKYPPLMSSNRVEFVRQDQSETYKEKMGSHT